MPSAISSIGRGVVGRRVGDAEAAAEVELGHGAAGEQLGVHGEQARGRLGEAGGVEDLRADVAVQAEEVERGVRADARRRARRRRSRETPNFWSSCAVARNSWVEACTPLLTRRRTRCTRPARAAASATRSISISLSMTIAPTPASTARSISATDLLLPWKPMRAGSTPAASATASSPPLHTSTARPASVTQRTIALREERLAGVVDRHGRADGCRGRLERGADARARGPARRPRRPRRAACRTARRARWRRRRRRPGGRRRRGARARARPAGRVRWRRRARVSHPGYGCGGCHGETSRDGTSAGSLAASEPGSVPEACCVPPLWGGLRRVYRRARGSAAESVTPSRRSRQVAERAQSSRGSPRRGGGRSPRARRSRPTARRDLLRPRRPRAGARRRRRGSGRRRGAARRCPTRRGSRRRRRPRRRRAGAARCRPPRSARP